VRTKWAHLRIMPRTKPAVALMVIKVPIPPDMKARLKALADRENRSERAQAAHLIAQALEALEPKRRSA